MQGSAAAETPPVPARQSQRAAPGAVQFEPRELREVLARYALGAIRSIRPLVGGDPHSPKVLIDSEAGRLILKRRPEGVTAEALHAALRLQRIVFDARGPVPEPIAAMDGGATASIGGHATYALERFVQGGSCPRTPAAARSAGLALGAFHATLASCEPPAGLPCRPPLSEQGVMQGFKELASLLPALVGASNRLAAAWSWAVGAGGDPTAVPHAPLHGDLHPGNTVYAGSDLTAIVDLTRAGIGSQFHEAASAAVLFSLAPLGPDARAWTREADDASLASFWRGYLGKPREPRRVRVVVPAMVVALAEQAAVSRPSTQAFGRRRPAELMAYVADVAADLRARRDAIEAAIADDERRRPAGKPA